MTFVLERLRSKANAVPPVGQPTSKLKSPPQNPQKSGDFRGNAFQPANEITLPPVTLPCNLYKCFVGQAFNCLPTAGSALCGVPRQVSMRCVAAGTRRQAANEKGQMTNDGGPFDVYYRKPQYLSAPLAAIYFLIFPQ
jgi:hypothetical protein